MRSAESLCHRRIGFRPAAPATSRGEQGAAIIMVLIFMILVSTAVAGLLGLAQTSTRSLKTYEVDRGLRYGADAALEVGINKVAKDYTLGRDTTAGSSGCEFQSAIEAARPELIAAGSYVTVKCTALETTAGSNPQTARKVKFEVFCKTSGYSPSGKIECGSSGADRKLASAVVRFEPNYALAQDQWAVIPKVLAWNLER